MIQGRDLDAQYHLQKQQENRAHAAQWLLEVPSLSQVLLMCNESYCAETAHMSPPRTVCMYLSRAHRIGTNLIFAGL